MRTFRGVVCIALGCLLSGFFGCDLFIEKPDTISWERVNGGFYSSLTANTAGLFALSEHQTEVLRSTDGGRTWSVVLAPESPASDRTFRLVLAAGLNRDVYAGLTLVGRTPGANWLYRSSDGGDSWELILSRPDWLRHSNLFSLGVNRQGTLYLGPGGFNSAQVVHRSKDRGTTWTPTMLATDELGTDITLLRFGSDEVVFASLGSLEGWRVSVDGGEPVRLPLIAFQSFAPGLSGEREVLGIGAGGVYRSEDQGRTWTLASPVSDALSVLQSPSALAVTKRKEVLLGTESGGMFRSQDIRRLWERVNDGLPRVENNERMEDWQVAPIRDIVLGADGYAYVQTETLIWPEGGLFRSTAPVE